MVENRAVTPHLVSSSAEIAMPSLADAINHMLATGIVAAGILDGVIALAIAGGLWYWRVKRRKTA